MRWTRRCGVSCDLRSLAGGANGAIQSVLILAYAASAALAHLPSLGILGVGGIVCAAPEPEGGVVGTLAGACAGLHAGPACSPGAWPALLGGFTDCPWHVERPVPQIKNLDLIGYRRCQASRLHVSARASPEAEGSLLVAPVVISGWPWI